MNTHKRYPPESRERVNQQVYQERIEALCAYATEDGYSLNPASERDFWTFINSAPYISKGDLVLSDNGNLHAVWESGEDNYFSLQFLGDGLLQYVIFKQRTGSKSISRVAGRDNMDGIKRQITAFDLGPLLNMNS